MFHGIPGTGGIGGGMKFGLTTFIFQHWNCYNVIITTVIKIAFFFSAAPANKPELYEVN